MLLGIDEIIKRIHQKDKKSFKKLPTRPPNFDAANIKNLLALLKPIQEATDKLQTENISISSVIIAILVIFEGMNYYCLKITIELIEILIFWMFL